MDEKEILEKLSSLEVPDVELPGHRVRLQKMLLETPPPGRGFFQSIKTAFRYRARALAAALNTPRPAWQMVLVGALLTVLVAGSVVTVPAIARPTDQELARSIALASDVLKNAMGGRDAPDIDPALSVTVGKDRAASVIVQSRQKAAGLTDAFTSRAWWAFMTLDLESESVTSFAFSRDGLTTEEEREITSILLEYQSSRLLMTGTWKIEELTRVQCSGTLEQDAAGRKALSSIKAVTVRVYLLEGLEGRSFEADVNLSKRAVNNLKMIGSWTG
jgi:hypothetical protein